MQHLSRPTNFVGFNILGQSSFSGLSHFSVVSCFVQFFFSGVACCKNRGCYPQLSCHILDGKIQVIIFPPTVSTKTSSFRQFSVDWFCFAGFFHSWTECSSYRVLSDGERSQNYQYRSVKGAKLTCDRWLPRDWYRFTGLAGDRMPNNSVPAYRCGTLAPGWLRGAHPSVRDGAVSRTVCFYWGGNNCRWRRRILVRKCGDFYVYKLQNAPVCKLRYCGVGKDTGKAKFFLTQSNKTWISDLHWGQHRRCGKFRFVATAEV